ncbi:MAG: hypothetical protein B7C54_11920 [Acidimicrobiales bacterium mtb01]|nr:DUF192 domain-containing protein [Actinomycetota bacterium]TEX46013.1 MAG: hypothetical protein B7C54_11920 [Acidimicrobiales bacterium mtb01]
MTEPATTAEAWLMCDGRVLASAEIAATRSRRRRGLIGRRGLSGALVLAPCSWVHTVGMSFALDVAYLDRDGVVIKTVQMDRFRVGAPVPRARSVVEAERGAFARWGLRVGDRLEIREPS